MTTLDNLSDDDKKALLLLAGWHVLRVTHPKAYFRRGRNNTTGVFITLDAAWQEFTDAHNTESREETNG